MTTVEWDYSELAHTYDKRADYSLDAISQVLVAIGAAPWKLVADIGAGTGKLCVPLAKLGLTVQAVEPNDNMRAYGQRNSEGLSVLWRDGTGENTGLPPSSVHATFFGSSFNVVDQAAALKECARILAPVGWFVCLWNHRDLEEPLQRRIEEIIKAHIPGYGYGLRREDPSTVIEGSGLFGKVAHCSGRFVARVDRDDFVDAWKSHATVARQAGPQFTAIIDEIRAALGQQSVVEVPYTTRIWYAPLIADHAGKP